jgi:hypothetical protein
MSMRQILLLALIICCFLLLAPYAGIRLFPGPAQNSHLIDETPKASPRIAQPKPELHEIESLLSQKEAQAKR